MQLSRSRYNAIKSYQVTLTKSGKSIIMTNLEQRRKIEELVNTGKSSPQIAKSLNLTLSVVRKWRQRIKKGIPFTLRWVVRRKVL